MTYILIDLYFGFEKEESGHEEYTIEILPLRWPYSLHSERPLDSIGGSVVLVNDPVEWTTTGIYTLLSMV